VEFIASDAINGLLGGLMIGCAAAMLLLANGKIAGISGIAAILIGSGDRSGAGEKFAFLIGLVVAPLLFISAFGRLDLGISTNPLLLGLAGILVGLGTRLGNGCTSGHGVCGLSRFSTRSLASVITFMGVAMLVASVTALFIGNTQ